MTKLPDKREIAALLEAAASEDCGTDLTRRPSFQMDLARYEKVLEGTDIPAEHKQQMIEALWTIIVAFVEIGYGTHPVQQARERENGDLLEGSKAPDDDLYSGQSPNNRIESVTRPPKLDATME